ncbi:uncharacterized protein ASPGLDRAFT_39764 [Aspergillus glaucus CBS 516.65]|uniref:Uncharacterized protein n=1 Tax=Aspergillus glaucus CBS 516.65 TaxID=1160497 RepID=A0A1L9V713_ASPGL|nr:hypothetical protein ASPGLDRAFT_39764 [Aspergillus glaucus CBS 516.65]OJJ79659.1 hypothetical protein ASPGLDRAFT_39764 [Aspergillus glaucus CBS 516.65]
MYHELILTVKEYMSTVTAVGPHNSAASSTLSKKKTTRNVNTVSQNKNSTVTWKSKRRSPQAARAAVEKQHEQEHNNLSRQKREVEVGSSVVRRPAVTGP